MKRVVKVKNSKFNSLASLIVLAVMLGLFSLFIPEFIVSIEGRIFTGIWSFLAIAAFIAHARNITDKAKSAYQNIPLSMKKEKHAYKKACHERVMREM